MLHWLIFREEGGTRLHFDEGLSSISKDSVNLGVKLTTKHQVNVLKYAKLHLHFVSDLLKIISHCRIFIY